MHVRVTRFTRQRYLEKRSASAPASAQHFFSSRFKRIHLSSASAPYTHSFSNLGNRLGTCGGDTGGTAEQCPTLTPNMTQWQDTACNIDKCKVE